jgi:diguanylate cyclase (GGDEF)-like protein/PAS domain S-box-containing protein
MSLPSLISRHILLVALVWSVIVFGSLFINSKKDREQMMETAYAEARANLNKDITFRRWGTRHGGVYVPITETQASVPWLEHVAGRDVTTTDGQHLTLLNPASMLRQIMDAYAEDYGVRGRITGRKYLNPGNAPDPWEALQLERFERGETKEVWEVAQLDNKPYLRHLRAMYMEPGCDKCHAVLGYKTGDMRGATGLNLPLAGYYERLDTSLHQLLLTHGAIWLFGLMGIGWTGSRLQRYDREREKNQASLRLYANMFEHSGEAILITDHDNHIVEVNPALERMTGYAFDELQGKNPRVLASGQTSHETYVAMWAALGESGFWQGELWDRHKDGGIYPKWSTISAMRDARGGVTHYFAGYTDISERKDAERRIEHLAHHDALTGLFNRHSLENRLGQALLTARRADEPLAVIFIDMDRFKLINDSLGHHVGDQLLIEVAARLKASVRESDVVARLGGDEFVVVLTGMDSALDATAVTGKILTTLGQPYELCGTTLHSTPSIGVSIFPADGNDVDTLMQNADAAMYHAKEQGRNNIQFFTASMNVAVGERLELERELRLGLERGEFLLHYQPVVDTASGVVVKVEALLRWQNPLRGWVPPLKFIPLAEETGLIESLGTWVLVTACRQLATWRAAGFSVGMAVNLSAQQLRSNQLPGLIRTCIAHNALQPGELELEITESTAMDNPERAIGQLKALRDLGVVLAIDDFGTGYSSLAYLKLLPIQILKLDRSFVRDIETDSNDAAISAATIALAHHLGLKVVAEGIETAGQREFLSVRGCDYLQGYFFGKPVAAAELEVLLRRGPPTG